MVRAAIIGNGAIAKSHIDAYNKLAEEGFPLELAAICDAREEQLKGFEKYRLYTNIDEMLEKEQDKIDYADICLPTFLHAPVSIRAMEAGFNVLCEKPMALNYDDALRMCEVAKKTGKRLMIAHSFRFTPYFEVVYEYVKKEILGKPITACFKRDGGTPEWSWENWLLDEKCSGGAILDLHIHDINGLQALFGIPEAVSTGAQKLIPGDGYDIVSTNYYYKDGRYAHSTGSWAISNNRYYGNLMRVDFEHGYVIRTRIEDDYLFVAVDEDGAVTDLTPGDKNSSCYNEIKYYAECLASGAPFDYCTPESSADSIRIAMAEIKSADLGGERVKV